MSNRVVIVSLLTAVLLGIAALVLLRTPNTKDGRTGPAGRGGGASAGVGERLFEFAPSSVDRITVESGGRSATIDRAASWGEKSVGDSVQPPEWAPDAEWLIRLAGAEDSGFGAWPIPAAQVQGLLRVLSETRAIANVDSSASVGPDATLLVLRFRDGTSRGLRLAGRTLGGSGLVEVLSLVPGGTGGLAGTGGSAAVERRAMVSDELHRALTTPGPAGWRERAIFASLAPDASRVVLENARARVAIGRVGGEWSLRTPGVAPGDAGSIAGLLGALTKVRVVEFPGSAIPASVHRLDKPSATVRIESDRRTLAPGASEASVRVANIEVRLGAPGDAQGSRIYASVNDSPPLLLATAELEAITPDAGRLTQAHPTRMSAMDIGAIDLLPNGRAPGASGSAPDRLERNETRWALVKTKNGDRRVTVLNDAELGEVEDLLRFLTGAPALTPGAAGRNAPGSHPGPSPGATPARAIITFEPPGGVRAVGTIALVTLSGQVGESITAGLEPSGRVVLTTGGVHRAFERSRLPAVLDRWIENISSASATAPVEPGK